MSQKLPRIEWFDMGTCALALFNFLSLCFATEVTSEVDNSLWTSAICGWLLVIVYSSIAVVDAKIRAHEATNSQNDS